MGDFQDKAEDLAGKAKETVGDVTDNKDLENEGKADQVKSDIKEKVTEAGEAIKDKANEVLGAFKKD
ncbi:MULTISPECIES: CsbD family protein [unclassified Corynebacterium]|uniref:CsbD family protein n=1 Tax=unclassified Corynebacterium TaxID=2624378 RepID=UPI0029CA1E1E|nr:MULTISPECIES: CsbD family protein [unclassified Corynebacterium]WPF66276.1 CsbD family protein [Corynebacterium sp. 22KM0430]WPF68766.1 CsbD family protein [Corynebacterium sp. 21KM1197]